MIRAYQANGHEAANLDPLGMYTPTSFPRRPKAGPSGYPPELELENFGYTDADLDRKLNFKGRSSGGQRGYLEDLAKAPDKVTLRSILAELRRTYCGTLGVEYMHIGDQDRMNWIRERVENPRWLTYDKEKKAHIFERLCFADTFESFLAFKFNTTKRFGLDGGEAVVPGLKCAIDRATELGAHSFVIGMPHRGRLNVLANVMRKPMPLIFSEFSGTHYNLDEHVKGNNRWGISGDVKYHLGSSMDRTYPDGRKVHLSLVANPSHLECVNPVVAGKIRAKQYYFGNRYVQHNTHTHKRKPNMLFQIGSRSDTYIRARLIFFNVFAFLFRFGLFCILWILTRVVTNPILSFMASFLSDAPAETILPFTDMKTSKVVSPSYFMVTQHSPDRVSCTRRCNLLTSLILRWVVQSMS
jgi:2-oxoglutarate dehydrogenase complex dehydrogenase (E1) component-like enzyme